MSMWLVSGGCFIPRLRHRYKYCSVCWKSLHGLSCHRLMVLDPVLHVTVFDAFTACCVCYHNACIKQNFDPVRYMSPGYQADIFGEIAVDTSSQK